MYDFQKRTMFLQKWILNLQELPQNRSLETGPDRKSTAEVPSFTLRTALSAIPFVSDLCGVDVQRFQERSSQDLPNSMCVSVKTFGFLVGSKNSCNFLFCFLRIMCSARIRLNLLSCQILHHDSVSMIVSRFTSLTKNYVICCFQVTNIFCSKYGCASAFSARSFCYLGPHADVAISVIRSVSIMLCLPDTTSPRGSEADSRGDLAVTSL